MAELRGGQAFESTLVSLSARLSNAKEVRVGFLQEATYPNGTSVAMIAAIQNWGAPARGIPPRPFFSDMIQKKQGEWPAAIGGLLMANNYDALRTLQLTGEAVAGQLRTSIVDTNDPPLAESTLRKRGVGGMVYNAKDMSTFGAKPLVDTGHMLNSVDYEIKSHE
jgi:hypothetical protein